MSVGSVEKKYLECALGKIRQAPLSELAQNGKIMRELPNTETEEFTPILRSEMDSYIDDTVIESYTVHHLFERAAIMYKDRRFIGRREFMGKDPVTEKMQWSDYKFMTYGEVHKRVVDFGCGMQMLLRKLQKKKLVTKELIIVVAEPCQEWIIADFGVQYFNNVFCSIQTNTPMDGILLLIKNTNSPVIITTSDRAGYIIRNREKVPNLLLVITLNPDPFHKFTGFHHYDNLRQWGSEKNLTVMSIEELEKVGQGNILSASPPEHNDLWCICYSSGSTGIPKGAMITHRNVIYAIISNLMVSNKKKDPTSKLIHLSLAHILEKDAVVEIICTGGEIYLTRGKKYMLEDLYDVSPVSLITVPRVITHLVNELTKTLHDMNNISSSATKLAMKMKKSKQKSSFNLSKLVPDKFLDYLFIDRVKHKVFGPNLKELWSSAAPLRNDITDFVYAVTGIKIHDAYGLTESSGVISVKYNKGGNDCSMGFIPPILEIKIKSIPEMNLFAKNYEGEMWVRGPSVFKGYLDDKKATEGMLSEDGWCKTGDICRYDKSTGAINIIGRIKMAFKLAQGEFVNPEKVERIAEKSIFIKQLIVTGRTSETCPVLLITPNYSECYKWIKNNISAVEINKKLNSQSLELSQDEMCALIVAHYSENENLKKAILEDVRCLCKRAGANGYEIPKLIHIDPRERWSFANNCLTSLSKPRRVIITSRYTKQIDKLYQTFNSKNDPINPTI